MVHMSGNNLVWEISLWTWVGDQSESALDYTHFGWNWERFQALSLAVISYRLNGGNIIDQDQVQQINGIARLKMEKEQKTYHTFWLSVLICSIYFWDLQQPTSFFGQSNNFCCWQLHGPHLIISELGCLCVIYVIKDTGAGHKVMQQPK